MDSQFKYFEIYKNINDLLDILNKLEIYTMNTSFDIYDINISMKQLNKNEKTYTNT